MVEALSMQTEEWGWDKDRKGRVWTGHITWNAREGSVRGSLRNRLEK